MAATADLLRVSNEVVSLAIDILGIRDSLKTRERAEFLHGPPAQQARIAGELRLDTTEVIALVEASDRTQDATERGLPLAQVWEYDTKTATVADLTRRRDLLTNRLRVLHYLQVH